MKRFSFALLVALVASRGAPSGPAVVGVDKGKGGAAADAAPTCDDKTAEPAGADAAFGKKVVAVCFEGASAKAREILKTKVPLKAGAPLTVEGLQEALRAVHASGVADDVSASARKVASGVAVWISIKERSRVAKVDVTGATLANVNVKKASTPTPLHEGEYYDPAYAHERAEALRNMYVEESFEDATVTPKIVRNSGGTVDILMVISEGTRSRIGKITLRGVAKVPEAEVAKELGISSGDFVSKDMLERAPLLANAYYYERGFMMVRVQLDRGTKASDGTVPLTLLVQEGEVFRIGKVDVIAKSWFDDAFKKSVMAKLKTTSGQVFRRSHAVGDMESVKRAFEERGRNVGVEPETNLDPKKKTVDVVFRVTDAP